MGEDVVNKGGATTKDASPPAMPAPWLAISRAPSSLDDLITSYFVAKSAADVPNLLRLKLPSSCLS